MLLEYTCKNFRSIKEEIKFSMRKVAGEDATNRIMKFGDKEIESVSVIYGANGSGKSNFILSLEFMKYLVEASMMFQPGEPVRVSPHKLSRIDEPTSFGIQFTAEGIRYAYGFSVLDGKIAEEYLYYFPNGRQTKIFERNGQEVQAGSKYKSSFGLSLEALKENRLFLSCAANFSRSEEVRQAFMFFREGLVVYRVNVDEPRANNWYEYSVKLMHEKPEVKQQFLKVLQYLGTGIIDIRPEFRHYKAEDIPEKLPQLIREILLSQGSKVDSITEFDAKMIYPEFETDLMREEGTGIQKMFQMICPLLDIIITGKTIICDEIETGLHEAVVRQIIELFYHLKPDSMSQLIFTTHDTSLLGCGLFRRGQIWFTELKPDRSTDLYSLSEIRNVRKSESLIRGYMEGKYGAVPVLNRVALEMFTGEQ